MINLKNPTRCFNLLLSSDDFGSLGRELSYRLNYFRLFRICHLHIYWVISNPIDYTIKIYWKGSRFIDFKTYKLIKELLETNDVNNRIIAIEIMKSKI